MLFGGYIVLKRAVKRADGLLVIRTVSDSYYQRKLFAYER